MSNWPFRFVHAADLHLESLPWGVAEVPDHLRELFIEAGYLAAERVFETALSEEAEFLILSGDVLDPQQTGPRGPLFLLEQFERLAARNIEIFWAGGRVDPPEAWPPSIRLPDHVHLFGRGHPEVYFRRRDDLPLVHLVGVSRGASSEHGTRPIRVGDFEPDANGLFTVAIAHGKADAAMFQQSRIHYWALGGRHTRGTLTSSPHLVHYPGSPQGRQPAESGPHGCTLVQVDQEQNARTTLVPTDVMRWHQERVVVDEATGRDDLETLLRERMHTLVEASPGLDLLILWTVAGTGPIVNQLRHGVLTAELLEMLRQEYGFGPPAAWSVSLTTEPAGMLPPQWYEQQTIRGDFLRAVHQFESHVDEPLELEAYLAEEHRTGTLASVVAISDEAARRDVLHEVTMLGVDLLSGEETQS